MLKLTEMKYTGPAFTYSNADKARVTYDVGDVILINAQTINRVECYRGFSRIICNDGWEVLVKETIDDIFNIIT